MRKIKVVKVRQTLRKYLQFYNVAFVISDDFQINKKERDDQYCGARLDNS